MKASLKNYRQSPRKVRLVADLMKGKSAERAEIALDFLPKRAALPMKKLLLSAVANSGMDKKELTVKSVEVNKGVVLKRMMPRARGSGARINKRTSIVQITLAKK